MSLAAALSVLRGKLPGVLCLAALAVIAFAGLRPFNPFPENDVSWLAGQNGIRFGRAGIALGSGDVRWPVDAGSPACSLEIWLRPGWNTRSSDILTFYTPQAPQRFRLFQWSASTLLLYRDFENQHREMDVENAFAPRVPLLITVTAGPRGVTVYLDGVLKQSSSRFRLTRDDFSGQMILGTSPLGAQTWSGEVRGLALYGVALTPAQVSEHFEAWTRGAIPLPGSENAMLALYSFNERSGQTAHDRLGAGPDVLIPAAFQVPYKRFLALPPANFQRSRGFVRDVFLNVAGFLVLGFCLALYGASKVRPLAAALLSIAAGAAISLSLEALQMFLPARTSSAVDLVANTFGVFLGVLLACAFFRAAPKAKLG